MKAQLTQLNKKGIDGIRRRMPAFSASIQAPKIHSFSAPLLAPSFWKVIRGYTKVASIVFLAASTVIGFSGVGNTVSYFSDNETSTGNKLQAGIVGLRMLVNDEGLPESEAVPVEGAIRTDMLGLAQLGTPSVKNVNFILYPSDTSLPLLYTASSEPDSANFSGCDNATIEAHLGNTSYSGTLAAFAIPATSTIGTLHMTISVPAEPNELPPETLCAGTIVFHAYPEGVSSQAAHAFTDERRYPFVIRSAGIVPGFDLGSATSTATTTPGETASSTPPTASSTDPLPPTPPTPPIMPPSSGGGPSSPDPDVTPVTPPDPDGPKEPPPVEPPVDGIPNPGDSVPPPPPIMPPVDPNPPVMPPADLPPSPAPPTPGEPSAPSAPSAPASSESSAPAAVSASSAE